MESYLAFEVNQEDNFFSRGVVLNDKKPLPDDYVGIRVDYSSINYKDALASSKNGGVIFQYPKIPGIDLVGTIVESNSSKWLVGQSVVVTGYGLGVSSNGGFSQYQQVPESWLVERPNSLSPKDCMFFGTAGFTAALCVKAVLETGCEKDATIFVTGASGGVGSLAIALLKSHGFSNIHAISRKSETKWLLDVGAKNVRTFESLGIDPGKPLNKQIVDIVIDTVGGHQMGALLSAITYNGHAILCGNAGGIKLETTVLPLILRGVTVKGIDSVQVNSNTRASIWNYLTDHRSVLDTIVHHEVELTDLDSTIDALLAGEHQGRTIVKTDVKK